jgi:two-component system nitrogen regulation response regulator GlnG/two-component system response regulator HydG
MNDPGQKTRRRAPAERDDAESGARSAPVLVVAWSAEEQHRVGELLRVRPTAQVVGRVEDGFEYRAPLAQSIRERPGTVERCGPLRPSDYVSREQLLFERSPDGVGVVNIGQAQVVWNDRQELASGERTAIRPGDCLNIGGELLLYCVSRPSTMEECRFRSIDPAGFGEPDACGIVGESPGVWALRDQIAFAAQATRHVLVTGPSGSGKELAAQAIHALSSRGERPLVTHSASDIPESIAEAELFGNRRNYPNPGMPERVGLIGQADGSTLFLDEIATLPIELQAKLLRVLDRGGEYRRLGVDEPQRADLRVIAATNADPQTLRPDLGARFPIHVPVPDLRERREDIPLLVRHALLDMSNDPSSAQLLERFTDTVDGVPRFHLDLKLISYLLRRDFELNMRELERELLDSIYQSRGDRLTVSASRATSPSRANPADTSCDDVRSTLDAHEWNVGRTAAALGWSRFQLHRKMRACGLERDSSS